MPKDSCYHSVKARYAVFPSARASQAIAKCRKGKGQVRKTTEGTELKRWQKEKWQDTKTGKPCPENSHRLGRKPVASHVSNARTGQKTSLDSIMAVHDHS